MDFTNEYHILENINPQLTYIARYTFQDVAIRLYIRFSPQNQYLIVTTDDTDHSLIHPFNITGNEQSGYAINGYWSSDINAAWSLSMDRKFDNFYKSIKLAIHSLLNNNTPGMTINTLDPTTVHIPLNKPNNYSSGDTKRYFWYVRSAPKISGSQSKKISNILGPSALNFLRDNKLNAWFTDDPRKQRTLNFTPID